MFANVASLFTAKVHAVPWAPVLHLFAQNQALTKGNPMTEKAPDTSAVEAVIEKLEAFIADLRGATAESVDPDVLVIRAVLHAHQRAGSPPDSGWGNMSYAKGSYDGLPSFKAALEAYRAARRALAGGA
jgi:hypothetical protein